MSSKFDSAVVLRYLGLPDNYTPSPNLEPIQFLKQHMNYLPPHILIHFSYITTPKQRTLLATIRNRRLHYVNTHPAQLEFNQAKSEWPDLWEGRERLGNEPADEERDWVQNEFLRGMSKHVGKLGNLLAGYEEERESERVRIARRRAPAQVDDDFVPEEDDDSDDEVTQAEQETEAEKRELFERRIREKFIYGLLTVCRTP